MAEVEKIKWCQDDLFGTIRNAVCLMLMWKAFQANNDKASAGKIQVKPFYDQEITIGDMNSIGPAWRKIYIANSCICEVSMKSQRFIGLLKIILMLIWKCL